MALDQQISQQTAANASTDTASFNTVPTAGSTVCIFVSTWVNSAFAGVNLVYDNQTGDPNDYTRVAEKVTAAGGGWSVGASIILCENVVVNLGTFTVTIGFTAGAGVYAEWCGASFTGDTVFGVKGENGGLSITNGVHPTVTTDSASSASGTMIVVASSSDATPSSDVGWSSPSGFSNLSRHSSQQDTIAHDAAYNTFASAVSQTAL